MLGEMIAYIRKEKKLTKAGIAKGTNINTGHLTHIEKGERNPSHKVLRTMCKTMGIPYRPLMYTYDKELTEEHHSYKIETHIPYDKIPTFDALGTLIDCPPTIPGASIAVKINDTSMEPKLKQNTYAYIEFNTPLDNRDIGLYCYDGKLLIRRFVIRKDGVVLRAEDKSIEDICIDFKGDFYIVGKVVGSTEEEK